MNEVIDYLTNYKPSKDNTIVLKLCKEIYNKYLHHECLSVLDGRYKKYTECLRDIFSEEAYISYRHYVEIKYFKFLCELLPELKKINEDIVIHELNNITEIGIIKFKNLEKKIKHDVKSIEYITKDVIIDMLKDKYNKEEINKYIEFVHFGLTSEDINSTAISLMIRNGFIIITNSIEDIITDIEKKSSDYNFPMLSFTHGQKATPIIMKNMFNVFTYRLKKLLSNKVVFSCKFGGATGFMAAHKISYPDIDWDTKLSEFISGLGLTREIYTTQISNFDNIANVCNLLKQICVVFKDMCIDMWLYISKNYFIQKKEIDSVGSSTMPHKINPINFENAEGNFKLAINMFNFFTMELPISRLQRDLSGSTIIRNIGTPFGYMIIALNSLLKGLNSIEPNKEKIMIDLNNSWEVITEAYQTILRKHGYDKPYELLKNISKGNKITKDKLYDFIDSLKIHDDIKNHMKKISPFNYN